MFIILSTNYFKMPYLDQSNMVVLGYGENDPLALVLFLPTINNSSSFSL